MNKQFDRLFLTHRKAAVFLSEDKRLLQASVIADSENGIGFGPGA